MNKTIVVVLASLLILAGCAHHRPSGTPPFDPENPRIYVINGKQLVVDQEPIYIASGKKDVRIVWQLPTGYAFPRDSGIVIEKSLDQFACRPDGENLTRFACVFKNSIRGTVRYKYTINAIEVASKRSLSLDPYIYGDF